MPEPELREPTFLLLTALTEGRKHGYALMQDIARLSDGRVRIRAGTLYGALDRLTRDGLVMESGDEVVDGRLRRYYDLSEEGERVLSAETRRLRQLASQAARGLRLRGVTA